LRSCIAWNNVNGSLSAFITSGQWADSDGPTNFVLANGNIALDPKFVNAAAGDLTLQANSPCIDKGDPADTPTGLDPAGFPRFMDGNLDKTRIVDMGAYEFDNVHVAVSGTLTPGGTLNLAATGTPGLQMFLFIGVVPAEAPLKSYGPLFMNLAAPSVLLAWPGLPSSVPLGIPASLPTPLPIIVQELGLAPGAPPTAGNLSSPVFATID
jgi:hypothetical protein